jgi:hypothetical protein
MVLTSPPVGTLAQSGGPLVGAIVDGLARTWLADSNGQLTVVMWPGNFRARFDHLEIMDHHGETVAHGGQMVLLAGGYRKTRTRVPSVTNASSPHGKHPKLMIPRPARGRVRVCVAERGWSHESAGVSARTFGRAGASARVHEVQELQSSIQTRFGDEGAVRSWSPCGSAS